jgi:RimJ/RimL family protein N-acetyltransferase
VFDAAPTHSARTRLAALGAADAQRIVRHLQRLPLADRRSRFGLGMSDSAIATYVQHAIARGSDRLFGISDPTGRLVAVAHLYLEMPRAEVAVSVDLTMRQRGFATALIRAAAQAAQDAEATQLEMTCLPENAAARALVRSLGMKIERVDGMCHARLALVPALAA